MRSNVFKVVMGLLFALVFSLTGCGGGGGGETVIPSGDVGKYAGSYSGTYSGSDSGTWSITTNSAGVVTGSAYSSVYKTTDVISGSIGSGGAFNATIGISSDGATFAGTTDANGVLAGTWKNTKYNQTGTFTGNKTTPVVTPSNTAPTVTAFVIPSTSTSLTVSITTLTATDDVGVTGYMVTEGSTVPSASSTNWSSTKPASFTFTTAGSKTIYAWAKDASGLVSAGKSASVLITLTPSKSVVKTITGYFKIAESSSAGAAVQIHNVTIQLYSDKSWSSVDNISAGSTSSGSASSTANDSGKYYFDGTGNTEDSYISKESGGAFTIGEDRFLVAFPKNSTTAIAGFWQTSLGPVALSSSGCYLFLGGTIPIKAASCSYTIK